MMTPVKAQPEIPVRTIGHEGPALITADEVGVRFRVHRRRNNPQGGDARWQGRAFWALRRLSFRFHEGQVIGIVGRNGSGKSTLTRLLAGAFAPDEGRLVVDGRAMLLNLGLGFKPDLSGRDNILISGALLGLPRKRIRVVMDDIIAFSGLGEFIDQPVRTYSSGMSARLGFSIAAFAEPDILILDEVLATGDAEFKQRANEKLKAMIDGARLVVIVSHQTAFLRGICSRLLWLHDGALVADGDPVAVLDAYQRGLTVPEED